MEKAPYAQCDICPLKDKPCALTTGPADADIAVVSRSPGFNEAMSGKAFAGPSGKVLNHLLTLQGVAREEVLTTNVVLCQTDSLEGDLWEAVRACTPRLEAEIARAGTVIAAGAEAARALLGDAVRVGADRGYPHVRDLELIHGTQEFEGKTQRVIITNNPAVVIRDDSSFPEMVRDFRLAINPLPRPKLPTVKIINTVEEAKRAATEMLGHFEVLAGSLYSDEERIISSDIEARGSDGTKTGGLKHTAEVVCAGFSIRPERAVVFGQTPCYDSTFLSDYLKPLYEVQGVNYLWHNGKYDIKVLRTYDINARVDEDTMLLSWCLDERPGDPESGAGGHSLEWLLKDELGWPKYEPESVKHFKKTGQFSTPQAERQLYEYNGFDTAGALGLYQGFVKRAKVDGVYERPYKFMLLRLSEALTKTELQGNMFDDVKAADILEEEVWPKLRDLRIEGREISKKPELNYNSTKQMSELLYDDWKFKHSLVRPKIERKGKRSTDRYVREEVLKVGKFELGDSIDREQFTEFIQAYDDFKVLDKQRGAFFEGLILKRDSRTGRIYTDFKIHGTESGRLSSSNPNMQQVTRPKAGMPSIREAFIPDPGCSFVSADLSQAELRTIAVLSGDRNLREIYLDTNRSLHKEIAAQFYGSNYTYEEYVKAKNINFGVAFWQSGYTFAQMYHMPREEADAFVKFWWARFPQVWEWTKATEKEILDVGELQSPFGHKRRFYVIPSDQSGRLHTIKQGINFRPQNIAGNITLWAMLRLSEDLDWDKAQLRINVHDNIVLNVRDEFIEEIARMTVDYMQAAAKEAIDWDFPFLAEVSVGKTWGQLKELQLD